jgi:hypothetical protein
MSSKLSNTDKDNIFVNFESSFEKEDIKLIFLDYLKTEFNVEPFNFLLDLKKLEKETDKITFVEYIIEKYILEGSPSEVNISGKCRSEILNDFEQDDWLKEPKILFQKSKKIVQSELISDNWKRFIRTPAAGKIIEKYHKDTSGFSKVV